MGEHVPDEVIEATRSRRRWFLLVLMLVLGGGFIWTLAPTSALPDEEAAVVTPLGLCESDNECASDEFCRLGICASWEPVTACSADSDCRLANTAHRFGCCFAGECEDIDLSSSTWVALNTRWFERGQADFCPSASACGAPPSCTITSVNEEFEAACVENACTKVPKDPAAD